MIHIVITTIQNPTSSVESLWRTSQISGAKMIVIGDEKGPHDWQLKGTECLDLESQYEMPFVIARHLPVCSYSRKNLGYLLAASRGAACIYETDDDNAPLDTWKPRSSQVQSRSVESGGWINVYNYFTDQLVWPRGLPLAEISRAETTSRFQVGALENRVAPIQQGLVSGSPDVDAIWRLVMDRPLNFESNDSLSLPEGAWCPFNSQSTWWFPEAYPLMYLPSFVSFRMTDIWRSFVAQRCLWVLGYGLVFHGPEMFQDRNPHNLMRDFEQEIPGYLGNDRIREVLETLSLVAGAEEVGNNCRRCYHALVNAGLIPAQEMKLLDLWLSDLSRVSVF